MFTGFDISASGMEAQRLRLNTVASNLANVNTTRGKDNEPYRRRDVVFAAIASEANPDDMVPVKVLGVVEDTRPFKVVYEPGHPDADEKGNLRMPNVNPVEEMVNMVSAVRAYEANVTALKSAKEMMAKAIEI